ncbi:phosphoserine aminotransferase [Ephemerocybe angulata]|uniref:phosphoserine transaminase n=1 Tax=Ephemerocybe angulata TaxID=980116 RepID=A0A8H6IGW7_9AGAR|nr:phosphoserine aminotransferase [Tulosesus angulatus]
MTSTRSINFSAGPSALPPSVLAEATAGLLDFAGTGIGIAEISHRSKEFMAFLDETEALIREQLQVPSTHRVLFAQGGGTGQFAAVVLNLLARDVLVRPTLAEGEERVLDYVLTGSWSKAALKEAQQLTAALPGVRLNTVVDAKALSPNNAYDRTPPHSAYNFSADPALIFYCENETVNGVQFSKASESDPSPDAADIDETGFPFHLLPKGKLLPLVADYSSSFMSRPIPRLADHAVIYAGAQKNIAPAGLTILIVREDCLVDTAAAALLGAPPVPSVLSYKYLADGKSVPNTPPVFSIYVAGLVLRRMKALGGLEAFEAVNRRKKEGVYRAIREGEERGVFRGKVGEGEGGSWMNVVWEVVGDGAEERFLKGAGERGMKSLKGHRSVGGIRASLYNAVEEEEVAKLVEYMREFVEAETTA